MKTHWQSSGDFDSLICLYDIHRPSGKPGLSVCWARSDRGRPAAARTSMDVDVIIIGSGQAGVPLAARLAAAGKRVLIAEQAELGGTCVNSGCTPTKTMIASARAAHVARTSERLGGKTGNVRVDLSTIVDRKNAIIARWRDGVMKRLSAGEPIKLVRGHARFTGE